MPGACLPPVISGTRPVEVAGHLDHADQAVAVLVGAGGQRLEHRLGEGAVAPLLVLDRELVGGRGGEHGDVRAAHQLAQPVGVGGERRAAAGGGARVAGVEQHDHPAVLGQAGDLALELVGGERRAADRHRVAGIDLVRKQVEHAVDHRAVAGEGHHRHVVARRPRPSPRAGWPARAGCRDGWPRRSAAAAASPRRRARTARSGACAARSRASSSA